MFYTIKQTCIPIKMIFERYLASQNGCQASKNRIFSPSKARLEQIALDRLKTRDYDWIIKLVNDWLEALTKTHDRHFLINRLSLCWWWRSAKWNCPSFLISKPVRVLRTLLSVTLALIIIVVIVLNGPVSGSCFNLVWFRSCRSCKKFCDVQNFFVVKDFLLSNKNSVWPTWWISIEAALTFPKLDVESSATQGVSLRPKVTAHIGTVSFFQHGLYFNPCHYELPLWHG